MAYGANSIINSPRFWVIYIYICIYFLLNTTPAHKNARFDCSKNMDDIRCLVGVVLGIFRWRIRPQHKARLVSRQCHRSNWISDASPERDSGLAWQIHQTWKRLVSQKPNRAGSVHRSPDEVSKSETGEKSTARRVTCTPFIGDTAVTRKTTVRAVTGPGLLIVSWA